MGDIKLSFYGAVSGVTGSCFLLESSTAKILIDCGFFQGERFCTSQNHEDLPFDAAEIDAVIVTHAHYDHTGRLPLLVKRGFTGPIYCTPPTKELGKLILEDAFRIMYDESRSCGIEPLYEKHHLEQAFAQMKGMNYHTQFTPAGHFHCTLFNAGHILGSSFVTVDTGAGRIVFSGDIGNDQVPILPSTEAIDHADVIISESTYGNRDHDPASERNDVLHGFVREVIERGGTLMIPAFSIERSQELLYAIDQLVDAGEMPKNIPIFLDSPLAIKSTELYRHFKHYLEFDRPILQSPDKDFFSFKGLKETLSVDDSKHINDVKGPKIIIAGSGMMSGGRIMHHLKRYLPDPNSGLLIIGYQASGTTGRAIEDGAKEVTIDGAIIPVRAEVKTMHSFSAHGDRGKMRRWLKPTQGPAKKIFLVHGDPEAKTAFATYLKEEITSEVILPKHGETIVL